MKSILTVVLLATALSTLAAEPPTVPPSMQAKATMCNGTYALCIMAPCLKPAPNSLAPCECVIQTGWNMGPNACEDRTPQKLTSTYSNNFNNCNRLLTCPAPTDWAWCYGAACEANPKDPKLATCHCPVITSGTVLLVKPDNCMKGNAPCRTVWSGALAAESAFANNHYYNWMSEHGYHADPPAVACPATHE